MEREVMTLNHGNLQQAIAKTHDVQGTGVESLINAKT